MPTDAGTEKGESGTEYLQNNLIYIEINYQYLFLKVIRVYKYLVYFRHGEYFLSLVRKTDDGRNDRQPYELITFLLSSRFFRFGP